MNYEMPSSEGDPERKRSFLSVSSERLSVARTYIYSKYLSLKASLFPYSFYSSKYDTYDSPLKYYGQSHSQSESAFRSGSGSQKKSGKLLKNSKKSKSSLDASRTKEDLLLRSDLLESSNPSLKDVTYDEYAEKRANYLLNRLGASPKSGNNKKVDKIAGDEDINAGKMDKTEKSTSGSTNMGLDESMGSACDNPLFARGPRKKNSGIVKPELSSVNLLDGIEDRLAQKTRNTPIMRNMPKMNQSKEIAKMKWTSPLPPGMD